jgi:hypothetical protein
MYFLPCAHCEQPIAVSPSKAGQSMECPQCGQAISVPNLGELKKVAVVDTDHRPAPSDSRSSDANATRSIAFVVLALLATACLVVASFCGIRWFLIEVPLTTAQHIADAKAAFQDASAAQLIVEYESIEEYGIDIDKPFSYQAIANNKAEWGFNAVVATAVGSLAIVGAAISASRR